MHSDRFSRSRGIYSVLFGMIMTVVIMTALYVDTGSIGSGLIEPDIVSILFWGVVYGCLLVVAYQATDRSAAMLKKISDSCAVVGLLAFLLTVLSTNLIAALLVIIKWALAAMLVTLPGFRPLYFILAASVTLVALAASQAKSTGFLFFIILFALLAVCLLMLVHHQRLLRSDAVGDPPLQNQPSLWQFSAALAGVILPVLVVAGVTYFLVPRPEALNLGRSLSAKGELYQDQEWEQQAEDEQTAEQQYPPTKDESTVGSSTQDKSEIGTDIDNDILSGLPRYAEEEMRY
ncbi:MAG: hypothetical protein ACR2QW_18150, partial [bacterium]